MAEALERLKRTRGAHRGVATKYTQEAKVLLETEMIEEKALRRLKVLSDLLQDKARELKEMDDKILASCPTEEIEREVEEAEEIIARVAELQAEIETVVPRQSVHMGSTTARESSSIILRERINTERISNTGAPARDEHNIIQTTSVTENVRRESNAGVDTEAVTKPKLPKITLPRFSGEVTKFRPFWDRFESAVDKNMSLSPVNKFNYLHALVEGPAARSIQRLQLTEVNYEAAKQILQERFGKTHQVISAHVEDLLRLPMCSGDKTSQLRHIYDKIQVNVRGLEALGVESEQYGSFLVPIIMAKLPSEVRLQIARITTNDVWKVEELLNIIKGEVEAREISDSMRANERKPEPAYYRNNSSTASALTVRDSTSGGRACVYCKGEHYSASCEKVTSIQARKEILKKKGRCFLCLASGHRVSQCNPNKKCRRCQRRHHQSICEAAVSNSNANASNSNASNTNGNHTNASNTNVSHTNMSNTDVSHTNISNTNETTAEATTLTSPPPRTNKVKILLQTARTQAYAVNGERIPVRVLFDSGSQKSYITNRLKTRLGLTPIKKELLNLNVFGSETTRKQNCDVVKVRLQGRYNEDAEILALGFSTICSPLPRTVDLHQYPQLQELELADSTQSKEEEKDSLAIDILIGSDFYWEIVSGDISRANSGLVAIKSKFGWLLSGPAKHNSRVGTETHCNLTIELPSSVPTVHEDGEGKLVEELKKFWETEAIGITERENIERELFPEQVRYDFIARRYTVGLPWKIHRPECNNYGLCVSRLHQLMSRLKRDKALLTEYNKILETA